MVLPIDSIRYAADIGLGAPSAIGIRPYICTLFTIKELGADRPGHNVTSTTVTQTPLQYHNGAPIRVRRVTSKDIKLSNSLLKDQDLILGPFVFPYNTGTISGGFDIANFDNADADGSTQKFIQIQGPGLAPAADGYAFFSKIYDDITHHAIMYRIFVRNTGANPVP